MKHYIISPQHAKGDKNRIEETIRFVKQCYGFKHIRVMSYESWRNMSAIVIATTYFTAAWLGRGVRSGRSPLPTAKIDEMPDFISPGLTIRETVHQKLF